MKFQQLLIIVSLMLVLMSACQKESYVERYIVAKVQQDTPYLAQLEAAYSLAFINFHENPVFSDDFYVRRDLASVFYGYSLKNAEIKMIEENNEKVLWVKLPNPKQISIDRKIVDVESVRPGYQPLDQNKQPINVDAWMNEHLQKAIKQYEEKTIEQTKTLSKQYFEALAYRFGVKLKLEFTQ